MTRSVVTADDVQRAAGGVLNVSADAIITPLARDVAAELGVTIVRGQDADRSAPAAGKVGADELADRVRLLVASLLGPGGGAPAAPVRSPVKLVSVRDTEPVSFVQPGQSPAMRVGQVDVVTGGDGSPVVAGYQTMTGGSYARTVTSDELQIVVEGELTLGGDGGGRRGRAGDIWFIPKGSTVTFETADWARFVYVRLIRDGQDGVS